MGNEFNVPMGYVVFSGDGCKACITLKDVLNSKGIPYTEYNIWKDGDALKFMSHQGLRSIPQLFKDGVKIDVSSIT